LGTLILKGRIFDGKENLERGAVVVDSEKRIIVDAGREGDVEEPRDGKVITANGQTILPGLIDAHVHFWGCKVYDLTTWVTTPETLVALRSVADLRKLLMAGFTSVREMGTKGGAFLSRAIKEGCIDGPEVLSCGRSLGKTGGDDDPTNLPLHIAQELSYSYFADGPWECRGAVRKVIRDGADFVKVYAATGTTPETYTSPMYHLRPQFSVEEMKAIVDEAHDSGLKVAIHAIGEQSVTNAIEAGADSIEHGMALTEDAAREMKRKGIFYVPTLGVFLTSPALRSFIDNPNLADDVYVRRHLTSDMELAKQYGLKIVAGTDFGGNDEQPHGQNYIEIVSIAKYLGNKEALVSATSRAAECLGLMDNGQIKKGFKADITVVRGNPLENIEALAPANIALVLKGGRLFTPN